MNNYGHRSYFRHKTVSIQSFTRKQTQQHERTPVTAVLGKQSPTQRRTTKTDCFKPSELAKGIQTLLSATMEKEKDLVFYRQLSRRFRVQVIAHSVAVRSAIVMEMASDRFSKKEKLIKYHTQYGTRARLVAVCYIATTVYCALVQSLWSFCF